MLCKQCGKEVPEASKFCPYCGADQADSLPGPTIVTSADEIAQEQTAAAANLEQTAVPDNVASAAGASAGVVTQQAYGQAPYGQQAYGQPYGQAYGQGGYMQQPYGVQPVPMQAKKSKKGLIIGIVLAVLVLGGVATAAALTGGFGLFPKGMTDATEKAAEKLFNDVTAVDMTLYADYDGDHMTADVKWEYGDDLKSTTIYVSASDGNYDYEFLLKDDALYMGRDGEYEKAAPPGGSVVDAMSDEINDEFGLDVDLNQLVKGGKFNQDYYADLVTQLNDLNTGDLYGLDTDQYASLQTIIANFLQDEIDKKSVYEKFMTDPEIKKNGSATIYTTEFDIMGFIDAFRDYAESLTDDKELGDAAEMIVDGFDQIEGYGYLEDLSVNLDVSATVDGGILTAFEVSFGSGGNEIAFGMEVNETSEDGFSLEGDADIENIVDNATRGSGMLSF